MRRRHIGGIAIFCALLIIAIVSAIVPLTYNRGLIACDTRTELSGLLGSDYFMDAEITDIRYKVDDLEQYTCLLITLRETADLQSINFYCSKAGAGIHDPDLARIPHRHMKYLEELGLSMENIQGHGGNFVNVEVGFAETSFEIHWYQIDETYDGKSNIILLTGIPRRISIDANRIMEN